jgi:hypothetical protein
MHLGTRPVGGSNPTSRSTERCLNLLVTAPYDVSIGASTSLTPTATRTIPTGPATTMRSKALPTYIMEQPGGRALNFQRRAYQPAYATKTGWDFGSGIGNVNAYNLVMAY